MKSALKVVGLAIAARMKEPSSWAGVAAILVALAPALAPITSQVVPIVGVAAAGVLAVVLKETK